MAGTAILKISPLRPSSAFSKVLGKGAVFWKTFRALFCCVCQGVQYVWRDGVMLYGLSMCCDGENSTSETCAKRLNKCFDLCVYL